MKKFLEHSEKRQMIFNLELKELSPTNWLRVKVKCLVAIKQFRIWIFHFSLFFVHFRQTRVKVKCFVT